MRIKIPVCELEFEEGGNTIWVHSPKGCTVLRVQTLSRINVTTCRDNAVSHADVTVKDPINICVHPDDLARAESGESLL
jgi:hypothetical protein